MDDARVKRVYFVDEKRFALYQALKQGRLEERSLADGIDRLVDRLRQDVECGVKVPRSLWPVEYVQAYGITNLRKCNLPNGWRLVYTIVALETEIRCSIMEWFSHKEYEKRFHYKVR